MQITIQLPDDLKQHLVNRVTQLQCLSRNLDSAILASAFASRTNNIEAQWSETALSYTGSPDFPAFESYRDNLLLPREPELF